VELNLEGGGVEGMEEKSWSSWAAVFLCPSKDRRAKESRGRVLRPFCKGLRVQRAGRGASAWFCCGPVTLESQVKESLRAIPTPHGRASACRAGPDWRQKSSNATSEGERSREGKDVWH
jgi:ferredoxin-NADP reductase